MQHFMLLWQEQSSLNLLFFSINWT